MGKRASQLQDLPLAQQRFTCSREASSGQIITRQCWHSAVLPPMSSTGTVASSNSEKGTQLLCANLADPVPAGADRGCGATPTTAIGLLAGHELLRVTCGCGATPATVPSL
jgi:hypothetical protein